MPAFTDQTGRTIFLKSSPQRIISLVPSQTELLSDLGLNEQVIGITKFCVHPSQWFYSKPRVGGTKKLHIDIIDQLQPDLIIANKEENVKEEVEDLASRYPVWISEISNLADAYEMIEKAGTITERNKQAKEITDQIKKNFAQLQTKNDKPKTCYLIWNNPYMTIGGDTFIHSMLEAAGFENVFADKNRYPVITAEELHIANCQLLLLSSEPFPFQQKHIDQLQPLLPHTKILLVDGEMFSWYGSRLLQAPGYFEKLITTFDNRK